MRQMLGQREMWLAAAALSVWMLAAAPVEAKRWSKWAPDPLGSEESYLRLSSRPSDSLTASQLGWVAVQRDWREQRHQEDLSDASHAASITETWSAHTPRRSDRQFARLASLPYERLTDRQRAWLVAEHQAQVAMREGLADGGPGSEAGLLILIALGGLVAGALLMGNMIGGAWRL